MREPELLEIASTLRELSFPTKLAVEVCSRCNLRCTHCHQPFMRRRHGVMPFDLWRKCADEVAAVAPETECWFSFCGEPLLETDLLCRMIRYGKSIGLRSVHLNTNGVLLTPDRAAAILDSGVDLVVVGIDGFSRETYESIRVGGNRDRLFANVDHLIELRARRRCGPEIQVQFVEMDENDHELEEFRAFWLARGASVKIRHKLSWGGRIQSPLEVPQRERIPCPWALTVLHVFWDGRVPRCSGDTEGEECVGNAAKATLQQLWERLAPYRRVQLERRFEDLPERCLFCKDWMTGAAVRERPEDVNGAVRREE